MSATVRLRFFGITAAFVLCQAFVCAYRIGYHVLGFFYLRIRVEDSAYADYIIKC